MSKELKAFENIMRIYGETNSLEGTYNDFLTIKKALQRLEQIENAKPSEALRAVNNELEDCYEYEKRTGINNVVSMAISKELLIEIQQSLIKSQEQEKVLEIIFEKNVDVWQLKQCDFERYNFWIRVYWSDFRKELTEEEFEILKR